MTLRTFQTFLLCLFSAITPILRSMQKEVVVPESSLRRSGSFLQNPFLAARVKIDLIAEQGRQQDLVDEKKKALRNCSEELRKLAQEKWLDFVHYLAMDHDKRSEQSLKEFKELRTKAELYYGKSLHHFKGEGNHTQEIEKKVAIEFLTLKYAWKLEAVEILWRKLIQAPCSDFSYVMYLHILYREYLEDAKRYFIELTKITKGLEQPKEIQRAVEKEFNGFPRKMRQIAKNYHYDSVKAFCTGFSSAEINELAEKFMKLLEKQLIQSNLSEYCNERSLLESDSSKSQFLSESFDPLSQPHPSPPQH